MTIRLGDLSACFEGVIPSIIATAAPDGTPNISYLSHVVMVDDDHVALSNQFFSKTAANIRANPAASLLVVDPRDGAQYQLGVIFDRSLGEGELFETMAVQLKATSAQLGMSNVMRLRGVDIYRVEAVRAIPSSGGTHAPPPVEAASRLAATAAIARAVSQASDAGAIVDAILDGINSQLGFANVMLLLKEEARERLVTIGTRGYGRSGIGSEAAIGEGVIGMAASKRRAVRVSDMSRVKRFGAAIHASSAEENRTRTITLPGMPDAMSQVALPMIAQARLRGVLLLESARRLAFTREDEAALAIIAAQAAAALALAESEAGEGLQAAPSAASTTGTQGRSFRVVHHAYDDSVFIDNEYLIKGVPGRLMMFLLRIHQREGRADFTNREIRLAEELRLPDIKDNLETRLLLLRRRLEEKGAPIQLMRTGRGRIRLELAGRPVVGEGD